MLISPLTLNVICLKQNRMASAQVYTIIVPIENAYKELDVVRRIDMAQSWTVIVKRI